jgi:cholesterol oxidase
MLAPGGQAGVVVPRRILRAHGGILRYLENYPAANAQRKRPVAYNPPPRLLPAPAPQRLWIRAANRVGGRWRDIGAAAQGRSSSRPAIGVTAAAYALDTVEVNLVEPPCHTGNDVWLFDCRASARDAVSAEPVHGHAASTLGYGTA